MSIPHDTHQKLASIGVVVASLLFAQMLVIQKYAQSQNLDLYPIIIGSFLVAGLILLPCAWKAHIKHLPFSTICGLIGVAVTRLGTAWCYLHALSILPASNAVLLFYLAPFFVLLQTSIFGFEPFRPIYLFVCLFSFLGIGIILGINNNLPINGIGFGLLSACFLSWQYILTKKYIPTNKTLPYYSLSAVMLSILLAGIFLVLYISQSSLFFSFNSHVIIVSCTLAIVTLFPALIIARCIQIIGSNKTSIYAFSEPLFVILIACVAGWESFTIKTLLGTSMVIISLYILLTRTTEKSKQSMHSI